MLIYHRQISKISMPFSFSPPSLKYTCTFNTEPLCHRQTPLSVLGLDKFYLFASFVFLPAICAASLLLLLILSCVCALCFVLFVCLSMQSVVFVVVLA